MLAIADAAAAADPAATTVTAAGLPVRPAALVVPSFFLPRPVSDKKSQGHVKKDTTTTNTHVPKKKSSVPH